MHYLNGDSEQAEDVVQDCFVKLWQHQPQKPKPFLYTSVRNACIDQMRRRKIDIADVRPQDLDGYISDSEAQERSVQEAALWTAIDHLPERCRQVFLMSKRDGMKYQEIATELNISMKTVEHQISKAMKMLKADREHLLFVVTFLP